MKIEKIFSSIGITIFLIIGILITISTYYFLSKSNMLTKQGGCSDYVKYEAKSDTILSSKCYYKNPIITHWKYDKEKITHNEAFNLIQLGMNIEHLNWVAKKEYMEKSKYLQQVK